METDISIELPHKKIIMDTKYYKSALVRNRGKYKLKRLYSYIKPKDIKKIDTYSFHLSVYLFYFNFQISHLSAYILHMLIKFWRGFLWHYVDNYNYHFGKMLLL